MTKTSALLLFLVLATPAATAASRNSVDATQIESITGLMGKFNEKEGVFKVTKPRTDVPITVDGWTMPPFMGLSSWAGFGKGRKNAAMVMGDLVLLQDEVNPVMSALFEKGLDVTALHNHFFYDDPKVYFMHLSGEGSAAELAQGVRAAFDKIKELRAASARPASGFDAGSLSPLPKTSAITAQALEDVFKKPGESKDGMFKAVFGRHAKMACGCDAGKDLGVNTWAAFAGADDNALVDGDFAVLESELQPVLRSLRKRGINIVAIHQHMTGEKPRTLFLHYWGRGKAVELAKAIAATLALTKSQ